jgi:putative resolvase
MFVSAVHIKKTVIQVSSDTLRSWADTGKIRSVRPTPNGKRYYHIQDVANKVGVSPEAQTKEKIAYARVSSPNQKADIERQIADLRAAYPGYTVISDIGSGLNYKRPGLQKILDTAYNGNLQEVVVMYKDRLCRLAFDLIQSFLEKAGAKIVVHHKVEGSQENELAEDLLAIVTVFTARHHGLRKGRNLRTRRQLSLQAQTGDTARENGSTAKTADSQCVPKQVGSRKRAVPAGFSGPASPAGKPAKTHRTNSQEKADS